MMSKFATVCAAIAVAALLQTAPLLVAQSGKVLKGGVEQDTYTDASSASCSKGNTSPYAGMNPLTCHGVMAPTDSAGHCSLNSGTVLKQVGATCYYCAPLKPPIDGIIIPIDQLNDARIEGFECGVDQADPNCMAVCTRFSGAGPYIPPPGTQETPTPPSLPSLPSGNTNQPPLQGHAGANACLPFGPGGYDYCANPAGTQPPGCNCSRPSPPPSSPTNPGAPGGLPLPPNVRAVLMNAAAEMDRVATNTQNYALAGTDHFFKCLVEAVGADLQFLAQPGYVPAAQIAQSLHHGVWTYLTGNAYANNLQTYQAAQQALNNFKQDPACGIANIVPAATAVAVTHLAGAVAEANAAQDAANAAVRTANASAERQAAWGSSSGGKSNINRFNPTCAPNMCFPAAIAQDLFWQTGEPLSAQPFAGNVTVKIVNGVPTKVFNITFNPTVEAMLRDLYGSKRLQGPALSPARLALQAQGIPGTVSSATDIVNELRSAGSVSRGLVFVEYPPTALNPDPSGHVFNARNAGGNILFVDPSNSNINATTFFNGASRIAFYRTQ